MLRILLATVSVLLCTSVTHAQFSINQSKVIFSGQVYDAKTKEPLSEAVFHFRSEYSDQKVKTDTAGIFTLEVTGAEELKSFLLFFSHPDYREKDLNATLNDYVDGKAKVELKAKSAEVKNKRYKFSLECGSSGEGRTRSGLKSLFRLDCQNGETGLEISVQSGNSIRFISTAPGELEIDASRMKIKYSGEQTPRIEIQAYMFRR